MGGRGETELRRAAKHRHGDAEEGERGLNLGWAWCHGGANDGLPDVRRQQSVGFLQKPTRLLKSLFNWLALTKRLMAFDVFLGQ